MVKGESLTAYSFHCQSYPILPNFALNGTSLWSCSTDWAHGPGELGSAVESGRRNVT